MDQTVLEKDRPQETRTAIVDCDIHPGYTRPGELADYLPERWKRHAADFGLRTPNPYLGALPYPRMGHGMRRDSYPPDGGAPASNLDFMREQLLDPLNVEAGMLQPLGPAQSAMNVEFGAALATAANDWQVDKWLSKEPRLNGAIVVPQEDAAAAVAEIEARANDRRFVQITMHPRAIEPVGRKRYWPIYQAAADKRLPVSMHTAAYGTAANTGGGWLSFYLEEHYAVAHAIQTALVSMIFEGVFERFPKLKLVLIEGGFAWLPPLLWRMDREFERMRDEVLHLKRKPSEYFRDHVWLTTQPVEEPPVTKHLNEVLRWIGPDRLLFSTDYPHWDFDHPDRAFRVGLSPEAKSGILRDNARALYGL
jgi:predicted TIM-barrel fold metal-dependent hydrolase